MCGADGQQFVDWEITFRYDQGIPTANSRSCHDNVEDRQHKDVYIVTDVGGQVSRVRQINLRHVLGTVRPENARTLGI